MTWVLVSLRSLSVVVVLTVLEGAGDMQVERNKQVASPLLLLLQRGD
jgi:hypothetical protein